MQFVPVNEHKQPIVKDWQTTTKQHNLKNCVGVGLVCGPPSGNVECIDIDLKYDLTGDLFERYKRLIHSYNPELLNKLVVQQTRSGGYHLVYRCSSISGNLKLANRHTTKQEKDLTFQKTYETELAKSKSDDDARRIAFKASENDKVRVLLESRGTGGQFVIAPTNGYKFVYGDLYSISEITPEERDLLINSARQFNEVFEEVVAPKSTTAKKTKGISSFEDYNERGDVVGLLESHGWKVVGQKGRKTIFLRPGQTTSHSSGNYDHDKKWFSVFTTSTEFDPQHAYLPYAVFAVLECNKNFSEASKKLYDLGFGERDEPKEKEKPASARVIQSRINPDVQDMSMFATPADYDVYLQQVINGTLQMGLTTGSPELDKYFLFKRGNFVHTNGIDNVGKSEIVWWLLLIAAMYHGMKGIIFSSENTLGGFMRRMIQLYWGKPLSGDYAMNSHEYKIAKEFIEKHFLLIKAQEDLYNYKDIINLVKIALRTGEYHHGMIDPYNSLKIDLSGFSKLNTHEYHYEALSELKSFGQQNNFGWFINHHAVTSALRLKDAEKKYQVAPRKEDTEQGGKVANKADDFLTIHRITQHPTDWMITEIHVRKIKDTETGGRPTPIDEPVKFERYKGGYAYCEKLEGGVRGIDPIAEWHYQRGEIKKGDIEIPEIHGWLPYKDDSTELPF
ncbi:MAG TPA: bifunctional DNA primase/polymerase [Agriterribacter sp.]|nr:bifunctional DNA primase/polymerase [Agriterribacter sp.]